jgi:hypothetical protein
MAVHTSWGRGSSPPHGCCFPTTENNRGGRSLAPLVSFNHLRFARLSCIALSRSTDIDTDTHTHAHSPSLDMAATIAPTQRTGTPAHIAAAAAAAAANASNGTASGSGSTSTSTSGSGPRVTISANGPRRPSSAQPFHPPADTSTYRDLLLFEERLKMNAHMLRRRRRRYRSGLRIECRSRVEEGEARGGWEAMR